MSEPDPGKDEDSAVRQPPPEDSRDATSANPSDIVPLELPENERRLAVYLESRMLKIIRRETGDPYAGLPADDVLMRLDSRFPEVHFPERMMDRLETEQQHRHTRETDADGLAKFDAETRRLDASEERDLQQVVGRRAERVLYVLAGMGAIFVFTDHETVGSIVLGGSLVGVIGSFLGQKIGRRG